mmetsp:Transcript_24320/g.68357  ORF Transcript_24320/g.68357 Transcript_24320/m.68357 type:complete len:272 (-) Transcript_24320:767-1582(-)
MAWVAHRRDWQTNRRPPGCQPRHQRLKLQLVASEAQWRILEFQWLARLPFDSSSSRIPRGTTGRRKWPACLRGSQASWSADAATHLSSAGFSLRKRFPTRSSTPRCVPAAHPTFPSRSRTQRLLSRTAIAPIVCSRSAAAGCSAMPSGAGRASGRSGISCQGSCVTSAPMRLHRMHRTPSEAMPILIPTHGTRTPRMERIAHCAHPRHLLLSLRVQKPAICTMLSHACLVGSPSSDAPANKCRAIPSGLRCGIPARGPFRLDAAAASSPFR